MQALPVKVYTSSFCGHCLRAMDLLQRRGIEYTEISVEELAAMDQNGELDQLMAKGA